MTTDERSGSLTSEGFPHTYLEAGLEFDVEETHFETQDEEPVPESAVQIADGDRRVSLVKASGWSSVTIEGSVTVPEKVFNATLPYDQREDPPVKLTLAARCSRTILRMGEFGTTSSFGIDGAGEYEVNATLPAGEVRGDVILKPYLLRTTEQDLDEDYATDTADQLASDEAWTVRIDNPEDDGEFLRPLIEPFDKHSSFPGEEHLHYLYFENPSTPKLYLNANHGRLVDVLFNEGTRGADPRFRDVLYDYVEQSVWQELLLRTANDADPETGDLRHPWQEEVIELFAPHLYDDVDGPREVAASMGADAASGEDLDRLVGQVDRAIQRRVDHPDAALKLFQEGLHND